MDLLGKLTKGGNWRNGRLKSIIREMLQNYAKAIRSDGICSFRTIFTDHRVYIKFNMRDILRTIFAQSAIFIRYI